MIYELQVPVVGFNSKRLTHMRWYMLRYPESNIACFAFRTSALGEDEQSFTVEVPQSIINVWGVDDEIIPSWIESAEPWK